MLCVTSPAPRAAWSMFCAISDVAAFCSSTALEIDPAIELTSAIVPAIEFMTTVVPCVNSWMFLICWATSAVALAVCVASDLTSAATTAKPLPASPALAASIVAFRVRRLVCAAISLINEMMPSIYAAA